MVDQPITQRIDRWLWHARFVKTRTLAQRLITSGSVRVNRTRITSSSHKIKTGDVLTLALPRQVKIVEVSGFSPRRGPFSLASGLYLDLTPQTPQTGETTPEGSPIRKQRPNRNDRRKAIQLKQNSTTG